MDKVFDSSWMLRLTALFLAVALFLYIQTEEKRETESSSSNETDVITNVPLEVYYDSDNLFVTGLPETVDVKISGPKQIVMKTKLEKDFKLFVDLNSLLIGEHSVTIHQENFSEKLDVSIEPRIINVTIEEKVTEQFRVEPEMNSRLLAENFVLNEMTAEPSKVAVTGAKSVIDNISYVKATVSGEKDVNKSFEQEAAVKVLDRDLNKLDVSINPDKVNVKVEINEYSREVPIKINEIGEPVEGLKIDSLSPEKSNITVYGSKSVVDTLKEVVVNVDLSKIKKSGPYDLKIELPTGATKLSQDKLTVRASVSGEPVREQDNKSEADKDADTNVEDTDGN